MNVPALLLELVTRFSGFKVGDEVVCMAAKGGAFANIINIPQTQVVLKPDNINFSQAATIPITFLTAYYGLIECAKLKKGDRILIHGAAGGVGQAAIQLAQQIGAEIIATAHPSKWGFLRAQGVTNLMNSRTLEFAEEIKTFTQRKGVDVILNSLNGEFIDKSFEVLAQGGRFIEIGKIGIWTHDEVQQHRPDAQYFAFDLGTDVAFSQPEVLTTMFSTLMNQFANKRLQPLPKKEFGITQAIEAFRYMSQSKQKGKVVITHAESTPPIKPDASYVITGGLGALGLETAKALADAGAKNLVLLGRSAPNEAAQAVIDKLAEQDIDVRTFSVDLSDQQTLIEVFASIHHTLPPVKGILHAAGILDDGVITQQNWERFEKVFAPKVQGTWNLHTLSQQLELDFFVCFSSIAGTLGAAGQSNYAAANSFMDGLMHARRQLGLPGLSINWGAWAEVGMAASLDAQQQQRIATSGIGMIPLQQGMQTILDLLDQDVTQLTIAPFNWTTLQLQFKQNIPAFYRHLVLAQKQATRQITWLEELQNLPKKQRSSHLNRLLQGIIAEVLGFSDATKIDIERDFFEFGLDSLMAIELRNSIQVKLKTNLSTTILFENSCVKALSSYLLNNVIKVSQQIHDEIDSFVQLPSIVEVNRDNPLPLSLSQQRLWFLNQLDTDSASYNLPLLVSLDGHLNKEALEKSINYLVARHESLRTTFINEDGRPRQLILKEIKQNLPVVDLTNLPLNQREIEALNQCSIEATTPFNLETDYLLRARLLKTSEDRHLFIVVMHHIISDGWSINIFMDELAECYKSFNRNKTPKLSELPIQYVDFSQWQHEWFKSGTIDQQIDYWKKQLANAPKLLEFPTDYPRPATETHRGSLLSFPISKELTAGIKELCSKTGTTLFMVLLTTLNILLFKYTRQTDINIGTPVAGRSRTEIEELIGLFLNTLVLRTHVDKDLTFEEQLKHVQDVALQAYANQDVPFEQLIEELNPARTLSHAPLFQMMLVLQGIPTKKQEKSDLTFFAGIA